jgi:hypothetical protein
LNARNFKSITLTVAKQHAEFARMSADPLPPVCAPEICSDVSVELLRELESRNIGRWVGLQAQKETAGASMAPGRLSHQDSSTVSAIR